MMFALQMPIICFYCISSKSFLYVLFKFNSQMKKARKLEDNRMVPYQSEYQIVEWADILTLGHLAGLADQ